MKRGGVQEARTFVRRGERTVQDARELIRHLGYEPTIYFSEGVSALAFGGAEHPPLRRVPNWHQLIAPWLPAELVLCAAISAPVSPLLRRGDVVLGTSVLEEIVDNDGEIAVTAQRCGVSPRELRLGVLVWRHGMTIHLMEEREVWLATH